MSPSARAAMSFTWSWPGTLILLAAVMFIMWTPVMPTADGLLFPVTSQIKFIDVKPVEGGLSVRMDFIKLRDCQYLGVAADREGIPIQFEPIAGDEPMTLPTGQRVSRPWFLGTEHLDGLRLRWAHRCSPFWITVTQGYP